MTEFTVHTAETAPEGSRKSLNDSKAAFGFVPGLHAVMAESPQLLASYKAVHEAFASTSFNADELTVVWQTINVEHACHYCVPAHTGIAYSMKVDAAISDALRNETPLPTARLEALRTFTLAMVRQRGEVTDPQLEAFFAAGYTRQNVFEVILGVAQKVMSNYTNHIAQTPVDAPFTKFAWQKGDKVAAE
ncbi:carboxymuconolactone decarboxylase family protein [uncultured Maricaulis sp.]|mgnify:CR=1 FL=1|uniref:carboxymuconolactone decarboxylase family protein n=1 Tax=uncultured Maricaulis sp. TaxID=174710 RepID=UPI0030DB6F2F